MGKQKSYLDRYADTEYSLTFLPKVEITRLGRRHAGRGRRPQDRRSRPHRPHGRRQDLHPAGPAVRSRDRPGRGRVQSHEFCHERPRSCANSARWQLSIAASALLCAPGVPLASSRLRSRAVRADRRRPRSNRPAFASSPASTWFSTPTCRAARRSIGCRPIFDQAVPQWAAYFGVDAAKTAELASPRLISSATAAGSRRSA